MNIHIPAEAVAAVEATRKRHREQIEAHCRRTAEARQADHAMKRVVSALTTAKVRLVALAEEYGIDLTESDDELFGLINKAIAQAKADREALVEMVQAFTEDAPK
jgi:succinate dehydrogenase flavin-adding protein (antitoxin of CptAB toxin-antitoxin module)